MGKSKIYIRADGNSEIGLGHVIRSLALAEILKEDFDCIFVTRFLTDYIHTEACKICSDVIKLPETDAHFEVFLSLLSGDEIVVLDNYFYDMEYQSSIKSKGCKLVCIDDMHDKHFVADVVINHAPGVTQVQYSAESYTQFCLGLDYALLRKPFRQEINAANRPEVSRLSSVFVCFGGADATNLTERTIGVLLRNSGIKNIFAIVGDANKNAEKLESKFKNHHIVSVLSNLSSEEMLRILKKSDLAIVPSSSVLLEVFSVGIPVITGFYVENQKEASNFIVQEGLAIGVDMLSAKYTELLNRILPSIQSDNCLHMVSKQRSVIKNAESSYVKVFQKLSMEETNYYSFKNFTSLNEEEIRQVWEWRNHAEIRKWMYNQDLIPFDKHLLFIKDLKSDHTKRYWLVQRKGENVGTLYVVDLKQDRGELGYYIAQEFHEKNLGLEFYYYVHKYLFCEVGMKQLYGYILVDNKQANALSDFFKYTKEEVIKVIGGSLQTFNYRILTKNTWINDVKNNSRVLKLLKYT